MSKAEELLDSLSIEDIQPFTSQPDIEGHIVIDKDRIIHVPTELKRIAVQYDSNIETVTFDCPRYWDEHDLSEMNIYINYKLPGNLINNIGQSLVKNLRINEDDENIINFDWTIGPILTNNKGDLPFSVCAKSKTNQDSDEAIRWYTEINTELTISEGMDGSGDIEDNYEDLFPDVINDIISKLDGINATYDEKLEAFNTNATSKTESFDTNAESKTTEFNNNVTTKTNEFNSNAIEKTEAFNTNANGVLKKSNAFINGLMNAALTNEVEGVENVINDGIECPLFKMEVDGHTSEQVVTQGYNLLPNDLSSQNINGITITKNNDGSITLNGTATKNTSLIIADLTNFSLQGTYNFYLIGKNDKINLQGIEDGETVAYLPFGYNTNNYITKEYDTAKNLTRIFSYICAGETFTNETFKYMITQGSDVKDYEPYTGGYASPSPNYEQPINSIEGELTFSARKKNLLPYPFEESTKTENDITFTDNGDGTITVNGTATAAAFFKLFATQTSQKEIPGNYISGSVTGCAVVVAHKQDRTYTTLGASSNGNSSLINKETYTTGYIELSISPGTILNNVVIKPMLSNEQNVDWEPYVEPNEVTFDLGQEKLRSVGDVKDELVVDLVTGDYYKVENIREYIYTGNENVDEISNKRFQINILNIGQGNAKDGYNDIISMCSHFKSVPLSQLSDNVNSFSISLSNTYFKVNENTTINDLKSLLQNNNVIINYQLATPTTKKLGTLAADQLLKLATLKGYNYMTVTGMVDGELVNLNSRITYIQNANDYREIQNGKIAKMISNHPKQSMEGIDNTFDDAVDMELFELGGDGKSEQENTTGAQLFNANAIVDSDIVVSDNGKIIKMPVVSDGNGSIITNVTLQELCPTLQVGDVVYLNFERNLGLTYNNFIQLAGSGTIWYVNTSHEITQSELEGTIYLYGNRFVSGETDQCILTNFRITKGQNDLFEPFSNGIPSPSPDYEQPINSIEGSLEFACNGKNVFNTSSLATPTKIIGVSYGNIYNLKPNTTYTISTNIVSDPNSQGGIEPIIGIPKNQNAYIFVSSNVDISSVTSADQGIGTIINNSRTITTDGTGNIYVGIRSGTTDKLLNLINQGGYIQIEQGTQATSYEQYIEPNEVTFNLNDEKLRSVGDVKDELVVDLSTGDYYKVENVGEVVFDGSDDENWKLDAITVGTEIRQFSNLIGNVLDKNDAIVRVTSNYFKGVIWNLSWTLNNTITAYTYGNLSGVRLQSDKFEDVEQFKQWLSTHNTIVNYILKTPTTKKLGTLSAEDLAKLKTFKGYNNVTVNTNLGLMDIRFTYGLDVKKYIDNKIAELSAQLIRGE